MRADLVHTWVKTIEAVLQDRHGTRTMGFGQEAAASDAIYVSTIE